MAKDYYVILGVSKTASDDDIKKAFRRLAHTHHPDKGGDAVRFKDINEAYQILSDKKKRAAYDQFGSAAFEQGGAGPGPGGGFGGFDFSGFDGQDFGDLGDVLGEMFGFGGRRGGRSGQPARGKDIEVDVSLTFREVAFGVEKVIRLYRHTQCSRCHGDGAESGSTVKTCATCKGEGQVRQLRQTMFGTMQTVATCQDCHGRGKKPEKMCTLCRGTGLERREEDVRLPIPAGIASEEAIRVSGQGEGAPYGGIPGDLFIRVRVQADPVFRREDHDVLSEKTVPFTLLALGGKIDVPILDGQISIDIPAGTPSGTTFTLRGKGIPYLRSSGRGNHRVTVILDTPRKLQREQRELLERLRTEGL